MCSNVILMANMIIYIFLFLLISCVITSGCISNTTILNNTTENESNNVKTIFEPDNFLKTVNISENNTTLTLVFDEDFNSDFYWKLTTESNDILKMLSDEEIVTDGLSQEVGKHKWIFEGNKTGTTTLKFEYINSLNGHTPERYACTVKNTNGYMEILSFSSFSGNRTRSSQYTEEIEVSENKTLLSFRGEGVLSSKGGNNHWELEQSQNDILKIINETYAFNTTDPGYGGCGWKIEGLNSGNVLLTLNYINSDIGIITEIIYEICNENKEISILNVSYNSIKGEPLPYYKD